MAELASNSEQTAQAAPAASITLTVVKDGVTTTVTLAPGESFTPEPGANVTVDTAGVVLDVTVEGDNILFTNPDTGESFTLSGIAGLFTTEESTLGLYNTTTGAGEHRPDGPETVTAPTMKPDHFVGADQRRMPRTRR